MEESTQLTSEELEMVYYCLNQTPVKGLENAQLLIQLSVKIKTMVQEAGEVSKEDDE